MREEESQFAIREGKRRKKRRTSSLLVGDVTSVTATLIVVNRSVAPRVTKTSVLRSRSDAAAVHVVSDTTAAVVASVAVSVRGGLVTSGGASEEGGLLGGGVGVDVVALLEVAGAGVVVVVVTVAGVEVVGRVGVRKVVGADELYEPEMAKAKGECGKRKGNGGRTCRKSPP